MPVPRVHWASDDDAILGAPFTFCEKVAGAAVVPWVSPSEPALEEGYRVSLGDQFTDALAALHNLDWQRRPIAQLADAGRPITQANAARRVVADWGALIERFEEGRSNDMRMPAMGSQVAVCLRQMERAIRQGPQREIGVR